ncbi:Uncharacterised protein [Salmonella enterica subsp. enterica serovar Bovismorbificans]|uniref:Uncharacterized protein n=1 Tax=Salmonella enterica subsp. enterica serovar Bovismorbificans TaxID=58097 RepID=A0A655DRY4_SALET|nr:Uncharacterised protein [Salmonella enterica subsp. enterica serovar Bovismorbificans]
MCRPGLISAAPPGNVCVGWHLAYNVFSNYPVFLFFFPSPVHPLKQVCDIDKIVS